MIMHGRHVGHVAERIDEAASLFREASGGGLNDSPGARSKVIVRYEKVLAHQITYERATTVGVPLRRGPPNELALKGPINQQVTSKDEQIVLCGDGVIHLEKQPLSRLAQIHAVSITLRPKDVG
jgi:hypothetical protein